MTYKEKIVKAKELGIILPEERLNDKNIVGIYKFFYYNKDKKDNKICFYIGKSTNIKGRLLDSSDGHIYKYLTGNFEYLVPAKIHKYLQDGLSVEVEIEEIDYSDTCFSRAAHRLALAELSEIVKYQKIGQCLDQLPEGVSKQEEKFWNENYNLNNK